MKKLVRLTVIVSLLISSVAVTSFAATPARVPEGWLNGATSFERAMQLQNDLKVPLVVYFYVDWCPYCHALEQEYFPSVAVRDYLSSVVKIKINPESTRADYELGNAFGIRGYPTFFIIPPGSFPVTVSPFRRDGRNLTPAEFAQRCRDVSTPRMASGNLATPPAAEVAPAKAAAPVVERQLLSELAPPKFVSNGPLPSVDEVFKRFARVTGEALAAGRVTSRVIKGRVAIPGASFGGRFEFYSTAGGKSLTVTTVDTVGTVRQGFDGSSAWTVQDKKAPGVEVPALKEADLFREITLSNLYSRTKLVGKVQEGDREVYLVEATPKTGPAERLYFDVESGLLLHRDLTRSTSGGPVQSEVYFSNWRNVDGFLLPCSLTHLIGNLTLVVSVDEIKHNVALDDALFQRPSQ